MRKITTSAYMPTEIEVKSVSENVANITAYPFEAGISPAMILQKMQSDIKSTSTVLNFDII